MLTQYRRADSLANMLDCSTGQIRNMIREMKELDRYPWDAILQTRGMVVVAEDDFKDYFLYRDRLRDPVTRQLIPPYKRPEPKGEDVYVIQERMLRTSC